MVMKAFLCVVAVVGMTSCGNSSGGGEVKVFNTEAEAMQALRVGTIKQGDKFAVRE